MAGFVELTIEQGATFTTTVDVKDGTGAATKGTKARGPMA